MSLYTNLKEVYKDTFKVLGEKESDYRIIHMLELMSVLGVVFIYLIEGCNFRSCFNFEIEVGLPAKWEELLPKYCICGFAILIVYFLFFERWLRKLVIHIETKRNEDYLPIKETIEDVYQVVVYGAITFKVIFDLILCISGVKVIIAINEVIFKGVLLYGLWCFICMIYLKKRKTMFYNRIKYTDFFDTDGKRIAENDKVIYKNRLYRLYKKDSKWYLCDNGICSFGNEVLLENAVLDKLGSIKVYYWGMGERELRDK